MKKSNIAKLLKTPLICLVLISTVASYYAVTQDMGISWGVPIIHTIFVIMYFLGARIQNKVLRAQIVKEAKNDIKKTDRN